MKAASHKYLRNFLCVFRKSRDFEKVFDFLNLLYSHVIQQEFSYASH